MTVSGSPFSLRWSDNIVQISQEITRVPSLRRGADQMNKGRDASSAVGVSIECSLRGSSKKMALGNEAMTSGDSVESQRLFIAARAYPATYTHI